MTGGWNMTKNEVISLLEQHQNQRGIDNWEKMGFQSTGLRSYGIGLTQLRKLAKQVGRDHALAGKLWDSKVYDAKVIGLLIDEPKKMTREQAEEQVDGLHAGLLRHVFTTCGATLPKTPFAADLASEWIDSDDLVRRRCGFLLFSELPTIKALDDDLFLSCIERIEATARDEDRGVREAMNASLLGIGKRNPTLNKAAIKAIKSIGPVLYDYGDGRCPPTDLLKHLTSDYLKKKFAK
jgi:3-methyladenine DNA glycosylase AlkD